MSPTSGSSITACGPGSIRIGWPRAICRPATSSNALREQNVQVAAGSLGRPPVPQGQSFQYTLSTLGRLIDPEQFGNIVVKTGADGRLTRLRDLVSDVRKVEGEAVGGIQLGAKNEDTSCNLDGKPSIGLAIFQQPGSNALATADGVRSRMEELKASFPPDVEYSIVYDTTPFITESIHEVFKALRDAIILVAIVVLAFLQSWRATLIPLIAVPVAIVGTFAVMLGMGFSLNNLSLFGLVLAIGIVVDDAIVVVEAVEHHLEHGLIAKGSRRESDERGIRPDHCHFARVNVRVHTVRVHHRNYRPILPPVCPDHCRFDIFFGRQLIDAEPGAVRTAAETESMNSAIR